MLERLAARAASAGVTDFSTVMGDASEQHFPPDTFDVIYLCGSLGEIREREAALQQCFAALKRGGRLSIAEAVFDPDYQPSNTVCQYALKASFQLEKTYGQWYFFTVNFTKPMTG